MTHPEPLYGPRPSAAEDRAFLEDFATLSAIGATRRGGVERQAASPSDGQARRWLMDWLEHRDFAVGMDSIGNVFGHLTWTAGAPYILLGSHLDSQPLAGRWDGAYGVLAAAHAADRLRRQQMAEGSSLHYNLAVVDWFNEEGSRFKPSMMGSSVHTGKLDLEVALDTTDVTGISVRTALDELGQRDRSTIPELAGYAEIHVEQGREMERNGKTIGIVEVTWAAHKYEVTVHGEQSHSGATAMEDRKDALYGASLLITAARELADEFPGQLRTSVSELIVLPNSPVVVAREVRLHLDLRAADSRIVQAAADRLDALLPRIETRAAVRIERRLAHHWDPMAYSPRGVALAEDCAEALELSRQHIATVAGHDSTNLKDIVPTVMLFVPSTDGIAHHESEHTNDDDATAGVDMLTEVAARMCGGLLDGDLTHDRTTTPKGR